MTDRDTAITELRARSWDASSPTALFDALPAPEVFKLLLDAGASPDAKHPKRGCSILAAALEHRSVPLVRALLQEGADPDGPSVRSYTPMVVEAAESPRMLQLFADYGADLNAADSITGETALMRVAYRAKLALVQRLIRQGADVHARRKDGVTVLSRGNLKPDVRAYLEAVASGAIVEAPLEPRRPRRHRGSAPKKTAPIPVASPELDVRRSDPVELRDRPPPAPASTIALPTPDPITSLVASPKGTLIACVAHPPSLRASRRLLFLRGDVTSVKLPYVEQLAFDPGERYLVAAYKKGYVLDVRTGKRVGVLGASRHRVNALAFSPDGAWIATGSGGNTKPHDFCVRVHSVPDGALVALLEGHEAMVRALAWDREGRLFSVDADQACIRWDIEARKPDQVLRPQTFVRPTAGWATEPVHLDVERARVIAVVNRQRLVAWSIRDGRVLHDLAIAPSELAACDDAIAFTLPKSKEIAGHTWVGDLRTRCFQLLHGKPLTQLHVSPNGELLARMEDRLLLWPSFEALAEDARGT